MGCVSSNRHRSYIHWLNLVDKGGIQELNTTNIFCICKCYCVCCQKCDHVQKRCSLHG